MGRRTPRTSRSARQYLEGLSDRRLAQIKEAMRPAEIIDADELVVEPERGARR